MKNIILGTDWWTDCDDAVAIRLLARAHKNKEINLTGICMNGCMEYSVQSLSAYMTDMGLGDIPIGIDLNGTDFTGHGKFQKPLCEYPCTLHSNNEAENGVLLYRRLLAKSPEKVDIIEIGFMQVLAALLDSPPDEYSPLHGRELVKQKVNTLYAMAGKWDEEGGKEHNFCNNARSISGGMKVCAEWDTEIVFLGWEVGNSVISGGGLDESDLLYVIMKARGNENGRSSWDPMTVLLALAESPEKAGYKAVRGKASLDEAGANYFIPDNKGKHRFVVKTMPDEYYADRINKGI
ncbi:MAG: hypothetical protein MJ177_01885 [Clostridia bacterium]|nr:hypothetical protein [Clostridia bacterium]